MTQPLLFHYVDCSYANSFFFSTKFAFIRKGRRFNCINLGLTFTRLGHQAHNGLLVLNVHTVSQSGCHSFSNIIIVFSLQCSTIFLFSLIILLFHFTFPFNNNINVHQLSWYTCLITFSTWYRSIWASNIKVCIAQGSGFLRLINQIMIQKKKIYSGWRKREFLYEFFMNGYIVGTVF